MSRKRSLLVVALVALVTVVVLATATATSRSQPSTHLIAPGAGVEAKLPDIKGNTPLTFGMGVVCLDEPGKVTIESATVHQPEGGLTVAAFAVRPNGNGMHQIGAEPRPLRELGFGNSKTVDQVCGDPESKTFGSSTSALAVEVTKPSDAVAKGQGIILHYTVDGEHESVRVPFAVILCPPGLKDYTKQCF